MAVVIYRGSVISPVMVLHWVYRTRHEFPRTEQALRPVRQRLVLKETRGKLCIGIHTCGPRAWEVPGLGGLRIKFKVTLAAQHVRPACSTWDRHLLRQTSRKGNYHSSLLVYQKVTLSKKAPCYCLMGHQAPWQFMRKCCNAEAELQVRTLRCIYSRAFTKDHYIPGLCIRL